MCLETDVSTFPWALYRYLLLQLNVCVDYLKPPPICTQAGASASLLLLGTSSRVSRFFSGPRPPSGVSDRLRDVILTVTVMTLGGPGRSGYRLYYIPEAQAPRVCSASNGEYDFEADGDTRKFVI